MCIGIRVQGTQGQSGDSGFPGVSGERVSTVASIHSYQIASLEIIDWCCMEAARSVITVWLYVVLYRVILEKQVL